MLQARPGRSGKQQQRQNSPNLGNTFVLSPVLFMGPATRLLAVKAESPALHMDLNAAPWNEREIAGKGKWMEREKRRWRGDKMRFTCRCEDSGRQGIVTGRCQKMSPRLREC